ncbi:MAG: LamB/YcsF family protein [Geodermatophilaceae bacterium]
MARASIDLNCDLGEGFGVWTLGEDDGLLDVVTSANVACGFHGGDPSIMRRVCRRAAERGVRIGAQVGYRDLAGFGRRPMDVPPNELTDEMIYQIGALDAFARIAGSRVSYVKPHGALYNTCATDAVQAEAVVRAVREVDSTLPVLGLPGSALLRAAEAAGLPAVPEAFADRSYDSAGRLVSRRHEGAVISDPKVVVARCLRLVMQGLVTAVDGTQVSVSAASLCLHGDTPGALRLSRRIRDALGQAGVTLEPFG